MKAGMHESSQRHPCKKAAKAVKKAAKAVKLLVHTRCLRGGRPSTSYTFCPSYTSCRA